MTKWKRINRTDRVTYSNEKRIRAMCRVGMHPADIQDFAEKIGFHIDRYIFTNFVPNTKNRRIVTLR